jgi:hypothetical protein
MAAALTQLQDLLVAGPSKSAIWTNTCEKAEPGRVLFRKPIENVHQLREPLGPLGIATRDTVGDAVFDVKPEDHETDPVEGGFRRGELLKELDAQAGFLHHAADTAHLPFDPIQPGDESLLLRFVQHASFFNAVINRRSAEPTVT